LQIFGQLLIANNPYVIVGVKKQTATVLIASFVTAMSTVLLSNAEKNMSSLLRVKPDCKTSCFGAELFL